MRWAASHRLHTGSPACEKTASVRSTRTPQAEHVTVRSSAGPRYIAQGLHFRRARRERRAPRETRSKTPIPMAVAALAPPDRGALEQAHPFEEGVAGG